MPVRVCMTVTGSRKVAAAIHRSDATLGYESSEPEPPEALPVGFIDFPFRDESPSVEQHMAAVARHEPAVAVAPDLSPERDPETVYAVADEMLDHAGAVVVVPKREDVPPAEVPDRFRVGIPNADGFGEGTPWRLDEFRDAGPVHILGGSFTAQLEAGHYVDVASVDTSSAERAASSYWTFWTPETPHWEKAPDTADLYALMEASLDNAVRAWAERAGQSVDYRGRRFLAQPTEALGYGGPPTVGVEDRDLWHPNDRVPGPVPEELREWEQQQMAAVEAAAENTTQA